MKKTKCPLTKRECWEHGCAWFVGVPVKKNGVDDVHWTCAIVASVGVQQMALNKAVGTKAAVEQLRNRVADQIMLNHLPHQPADGENGNY